jgi:hypothetical protein
MWFPSFRARGTNARFVHPLDRPPRTAILVPGFRSRGLIRAFPQGWCPAAKEFAPAVIAGTFRQLCDAAELGSRVTHAIIPLAWDPSELLGAGQREFLWDAFGVPIFEQYLGPGNVLLASECDAHAGLHVTDDYAGPTATRPACACGRSTARLPAGWTGIARPAMMPQPICIGSLTRSTATRRDGSGGRTELVTTRLGA